MAASVGARRETTTYAIPAGEVGSVFAGTEAAGGCSVSNVCGVATILAVSAAVSPTGCSVEETERVCNRSTKRSMGFPLGSGDRGESPQSLAGFYAE